ncbi:hypothetical protein M8J76_000852 [Diaphorina citri]|jgi:hypothetical protein|nr:hypothetical protein M8J75_002757 [Diaphorina citri]KAI5729267.1 hypothetical protein M8J76_000852 [Diaphorina citri]KAI5735538.1 hypothetical protein M8J77_019734 [Diaphorina citri]
MLHLILVFLSVSIAIFNVCDANPSTTEHTTNPALTPPKMDYDYIRESLMDRKFKAIWDEELRWGLSNLIDQMKEKGPDYFIKDPCYYKGKSGEERWSSLRRYIKAIGPRGFQEGFMGNIGLQL